jgi:hypothetical protein
MIYMTNSFENLNGTQPAADQDAAQTPSIVKEDLVTAITPSIFENTNTALFSSIQGNDRETAIKVYNAINGAENSLSDHLGEVIEITDMVAHPIELEDDQTKETIQAMRVVLLTAEGIGYHSVSGGVVSSLQKIIGIVGQAPWGPALKVVPVEVKTRKGFKTLTLRLQA